MTIPIKDIQIGDELTYNNGKCTVVIKSLPRLYMDDSDLYGYYCEAKHIEGRYEGITTYEFCVSEQKWSPEEVSMFSANDFNSWVKSDMKPYMVLGRHKIKE